MKRVVWKNKSNNQLCVTIPKNSELKEGDLVEVKKTGIKKIAYNGVVADLFHYGHLQSIKFAKSISDYCICGIFTDEAVEEYRVKPVANLQERRAVVESLSCVDRVMVQHSKDPTENLKKIHEEFPEAEIILVKGSNWEEVPGEEYVKSIGGRVVQHPYYARLSTFKIINYIIENKDKFKDIKKFTSFIKGEGGETTNKVIVSSKADTLQALRPLLKKAKIEPIYTFTVSDWKNKKEDLVEAIQKKFSPAKIVVRSSAVSEDTLDNSMAGCFESCLDVDSQNKTEIETAVKKVVLSYKEKEAESSFNQILIQKQTEEIAWSGVVFTRTLEKNSPYYTINYDDKTGSTDSVTSGKESKTLVISHFAQKMPQKAEKLIEAVKEIEGLIPGLPLDIEFAIDQKGEAVIFQVRPLAVNKYKTKKDEEIKEMVNQLKEKFKKLKNRPEHLAGETTYFADMPDWNPAEIIGSSPNHLDYSLYDYLITDKAWHEARTSQGYYKVNPAKLVELFGNKPYVNVRNSFNSFTPAAISPSLREKLVSFYLEKLRKNPHLQDKVEFEVVYTCYDLTFEEKVKELKEAGFSGEEIKELKKALIDLTNELVANSPKTIEKDMKEVFSMEEYRSFIDKRLKKEESTPKELINNSKLLLDECRKKGTVQFARLARLGFIAKIILKSLVSKGIIENNFYENLYNSINTVATKINVDFKKLIKGEITREDFLKEYYHLRPGTYDITNLRYDKNPELIKSIKLEMEEREKAVFELEGEVAKKINEAFKGEGLNFEASFFINFVREATEARELSKFEFTKNLSEALELIAKAGEEMGFTRKEMAMLDINEISRTNLNPELEEMTEAWKKIIKTKEKERMVKEDLVLPPIIFSEEGLEIIEPYTAKPNFITRKAARSKAVKIKEINEKEIEKIEGSIVILENGDPGYDWIFTRNPAGLITKYGGVASHMSIRCAEFGIPAAIGCGEMIFDKVKGAEEVLLDCKKGEITCF